MKLHFQYRHLLKGLVEKTANPTENQQPTVLNLSHKTYFDVETVLQGQEANGIQQYTDLNKAVTR